MQRTRAVADDDEVSPPPRRVAMGLSVLTCSLIVAIVLLGTANVRHDRDTDAGTEARETVQPYVAALLTYSPETVSSDLDSERAWLTGDFAADYTELVEQTIAPAAVAGGVETVATVQAAGIEDATTDRVVLLLFVNVETVTDVDPEPQLSGSRLRVTALKVDDDWKISEIRPI